MDKFNANATLRYLERLSPHHVAAARALLAQLPPGWENALPMVCKRSDSSHSAPTLTHVLLFLLDPEEFPACRRIRLLAGYVKDLLELSQGISRSQNTERNAP
jgi:hypothetical protein